MSAGADAAPRRVRRLLRWYPRSWRARYGEEFAELLAADLAERPRDGRRTADVIVSGLLARCATTGLTGHGLPSADRVRAGLATAGAALTAFGALGVAMLAQLATGWQWTSPQSLWATAGTLVMTVAAAALGLIGAAAVVPMAWHVARGLPGGGIRLAWPAVLAAGSALALAAGARHFANAWPGTGGTGAQHGLVPAGVAAFGWSVTISVSSYWAHPALLRAFPLAELAWMALSPIAGAGLVAGLVQVVRRLSFSAGMLRYLAALAVAAIGAAAMFLAGGVSWVAGHGAGESGLFRPGLVNGAEVLIMALTLLVAVRAGSVIRRGRPQPRGDG